MHIYSPETHFFPGNSLFQLFQKITHIASHPRVKRRPFEGGKNCHPRVVHVLVRVCDSFRPLGSHFP